MWNAFSVPGKSTDRQVESVNLRAVIFFVVNLVKLIGETPFLWERSIQIGHRELVLTGIYY